MAACRVLVFALVLVLWGCASVQNLPINQPTTDVNAGLPPPRPNPVADDELLIGLAFSGGGTRAAAFSFGMLQELSQPYRSRSGRAYDLLKHVDFVSGVSGGSVTAAYFGIKKQAALKDFRERFLLRDAESELRTEFSLANISRAFSGGVNEDTPLRKWLDANLFEGATFGDMREDSRPRIWINATDLYNRTPFVFGRTAFSMICSDLATYPISAAVAASAAVPVAFAPVVIETFPDKCNARLPLWVTQARARSNTSPMAAAFAQGIQRYRDGSMKYIKLLDGGLVDNFGLSGFTIGLETADQPYEPMTQTQAVKLRRVLFLVADAGQTIEGNWAQTLAGPSGSDLIMAATDAALVATVRASYTAFDAMLNRWKQRLIAWRCSLSPARVRELRGSDSAWNCRDLQMYIGRVSFSQLGPERAARLGSIATRFVLPQDQVDDLIAGGRDATAENPSMKAFLGSL